MFGKELFFRYTVCVLRGRLSFCECVSIPFGFEGWKWDLIVIVPDYCLSFYFTTLEILVGQLCGMVPPV